MIAYYVHWHYPATADDALFYGGKDDDKLFHHKENAEKYAKDELVKYRKDELRFNELNSILQERDLTVEEGDEWTKLAVNNDFPDDYTILPKEIKFEDEV